MKRVMDFVDDLPLGKAKRSGRSYLCVAGGNSLSSPFQLTGDPRWDTGGDLYAAYNLELGDGCGDNDQAFAVTQNIISVPVEKCDSGEGNESDEIAVKAFRGKSHDEVLKIVEDFRKEQKASDRNDPEFINLSSKFNEILSSGRFGLVN